MPSGRSSSPLPLTFFDPARARDLTPFRVTGRTQQEVWASLGDYDLRPRLSGSGRACRCCCRARATSFRLEASRELAQLLGPRFYALPAAAMCPMSKRIEDLSRLLDGFLPRAEPSGELDFSSAAPTPFDLVFRDHLPRRTFPAIRTP